MRNLADILYRARITDVIGSTNLQIDSLALDSRMVEKGSLFAAVKGTLSDGHDYISQAIDKGAVAIVCEEFPSDEKRDITFIVVNDSSEALGHMASNFYDNPSEKLDVIAITGTNGKTTIATLLFNLFQLLGKKVGLLSTVENKINERTIKATHTTPNAIALNGLLAEMVNEGCEYCFMEASSHAIHQNRTLGIEFRGGVFTNITHDHLDYHKTFSEYIKAKKQLFDGLSNKAFAIVNTDDPNGNVMVQNCKAQLKSYALKSMADYKAKVIENHFNGIQLFIDGTELYTQLVGGFNAYNMLAVYAVSMELEMDKLEVLTALSQLKSVDGRFQHTRTENNVTAIVDYAHTPDALKNVLKTIKDIRTGNEQVITVVGCGGDRDKSKRPVMATIAASYSDRVILTSDNPRSEDPEQIIADMQEGIEALHFKKTFSITNRKEAIKMACSVANKGDIILIAGKGHEKYQEVKGERFPFDDFEIVNQTLKMLEK